MLESGLEPREQEGKWNPERGQVVSLKSNLEIVLGDENEDALARVREEADLLLVLAVLPGAQVVNDVLEDRSQRGTGLVQHQVQFDQAHVLDQVQIAHSHEKSHGEPGTLHRGPDVAARSLRTLLVGGCDLDFLLEVQDLFFRVEPELVHNRGRTAR